MVFMQSPQRSSWCAGHPQLDDVHVQLDLSFLARMSRTAAQLVSYAAQQLRQAPTLCR